jgi:hypothetical protein
MKTYHVGMIYRGKTLIVQLRQNKDCLSPEINSYWGERIITKKELYETRKELLAEMQKPYPELKHIRID